MMLLFALLIATFNCQLYAFTDQEKYPDLFNENGERRNEIDAKSVYVNFNRPIVGGFTTRWSDDFVTMIFVGKPRKFYWGFF